LDESVEIFAADVVPEQSVELRSVDRPDELLVDLEFGSQCSFGTRPIPEPACVSFVCRLEGVHGRDPTASSIHLVGETNQADADRAETAVIGRTVQGKRTARIEIPTAVAEL